MKFLIIQTAFIGDVVLATALVEKLHRHYPNATIDFLLRKGNEALLKSHPAVRQTIIWDKRRGKYNNLWRLLWRIRSQKYDVVVNCQRFAASGLLTAFSGAKERLGFRKNPFSFLFTKAMPHYLGKGDSRFGLSYPHELDRNLSLIEHLTDHLPEKPRLYPSTEDLEKAGQVATLHGSHFVCVAPTSVWFTKQWPAEKWIGLINKMPNECAVLLLGAPTDHSACELIRLATKRHNVINLCGQLPLLASAALMQQALMNYVNDSAPLHLASALDAPVTAIFCSTIPAFGFSPLSSRQFVEETAENLDCRPCGLHGHNTCPKGHFRCSEIEVGIHLL